MPLPKPKANESLILFLSRFLEDEEAREKFPNTSKRRMAAVDTWFDERPTLDSCLS